MSPAKKKPRRKVVQKRPPTGGASTPPTGGASTPPTGGASTPPTGGGSAPPTGRTSGPAKASPASYLDSLPKEIWLRSFRFWQCYHRYSVDGYENIVNTRPALVVGYHGRPLALDMCMLQTKIHDDKDLGYLPIGMVHMTTKNVRSLTWALDRLGFAIKDDEKVQAAVARGEHVFTTPGGEREGMRSFRQKYQVNWPGRSGYLDMAIRHHMPIIPVGAAGADDTYVGLYDPQPLAQRLGIPSQYDFLLWLGFGPLGLYPFSPPFPVHIHQYVGAPYDKHLRGLPKGLATERTDAARAARAAWLKDPEGRAYVRTHHQQVVAEVQSLLDRAARRVKGFAK